MNYTIKQIQHPIYGNVQVKVFDKKKERKPRTTKLEKKLQTPMSVVYNSQNETEESKLYAGISSIYVDKIVKIRGVSIITLSNGLELENCEMRPIKLGPAATKYLGGRTCLDFIDLRTKKSKLKEILPEVNTKDYESVYSERFQPAEKEIKQKLVLKDIPLNR